MKSKYYRFNVTFNLNSRKMCNFLTRLLELIFIFLFLRQININWRIGRLVRLWITLHTYVFKLNTFHTFPIWHLQQYDGLPAVQIMSEFSLLLFINKPCVFFVFIELLFFYTLLLLLLSQIVGAWFRPQKARWFYFNRLILSPDGGRGSVCVN